MHYVLRVHRKADGDECIAFDGQGQERRVQLRVEGESVRAIAVEACRQGRSGYPIHVYYGLPKGDKLDRVTRQLTELGATRLVLIETERSVVRWPASKQQKKLDRLQRIVTEAARQSGRCDTMKIEGPISIQTASERMQGTTTIVFDPTGEMPCPPLPSDTLVNLVIGPEGGFAPQELVAFSDAGGRTVHLGPLVLRTETAAPAAFALTLSRLGHW